MTSIADNNETLVRNAFIVSFSETGDFNNYIEVLGYELQSDLGTDGSGTVDNPSTPTAVQSMLDSPSADGAIPVYFTKRKCRDTSIGGNDAINCLPQFCNNDDIPYDLTSSNATGGYLDGNNSSGIGQMGRVYSQMYDDTKRIAYFTFGVPKFNNVADFYSKAVSDKLLNLMNNGESSVTIGNLVGTVIGTIIKLPALPLIWIYNAVQGATKTPITKYYDFKSTMPLYYRCVNSFLISLAINMGLCNDGYFTQGNAKLNLDQNGSQTEPTSTAQEAIADSVASSLSPGSATDMPDLFRDYGFDIFQIMLRKHKYEDVNFNIGSMSTDQALQNLMSGSVTTEDTSGTITDDTSTSTTSIIEEFTDDFITQFGSQVVGTLYDAALFVGFRVEKGTDTSESFGNQTGKSAMEESVNSRISQNRGNIFNTMAGKLSGTALDGFVKAGIDVAKGVVEGAGLQGIENVVAGTAYIDFPEVWMNSDFSRSYSLNLSLRSPYGDPYSLMQNLYIPYAMLFCAAVPRSAGQAAYTSPFLCRVYCRGMFSIPLGIISSMHVKRGADQYGWTYGGLPTCLDISMDLKDLSPALYVAIGGDADGIPDIFGANSSFQEYMATLSGIGLKERMSFFINIRKKAEYILKLQSATKLSPFYWGMVAGDSLPGRLISRFIPSRLNTN